jgi:hypothetical protein
LSEFFKKHLYGTTEIGFVVTLPPILNIPLKSPILRVYLIYSLTKTCIQHMKRILLAFIAITFLTCISNAQKKLVIMGSSTSACTGPSGYNTCYVGRLNTFYNQQNPFDTLIVQKAVGGTNVYNGMPGSYTPPPNRFNDPNTNYKPDARVNITSALNENPDVILVNFPSNAFNVLSVQEIMFCFRTIRDSAAKKNVPCFITTSQPRNDAGFDNADQKKRMAEIKDSINDQFGTRSIDFWSGLFNPADTTIRIEYNNGGTANGDKIHLNDAAHAILFDRVTAKNIFGPVSGALPATFLKNSASYQKGSGIVSFSTTAEVNVTAFEVQRSTDGSNFTTLGKLTPNNNPANVYDYVFEDAQPVNGVNYYRIAVLDIDGKVQYSPILKITTGSGKLVLNKIITQPNQLLLQLQSNETQTAELQILNNTGALVQKQTKRIEAGTITINVATATLSKGVYYLRLISNKQETFIKSFLKE